MNDGTERMILLLCLAALAFTNLGALYLTSVVVRQRNEARDAMKRFQGNGQG